MSMELLKMLNEAKLHSRIHFEGLDISVEVPAGGYRRGTNKRTGEEWAIKIPDSYGYIKGTHSPDGEHLDCYLRKNPKKYATVYVIHQLTVDGSRFDEDKVMLGYSSKEQAIRAFKAVTFKPSLMYGGVTEFDMEHFQLAAYSASKSHAMLTNNKTYDLFKKRGLLGSSIKSPNMIARRVSESLHEGLVDIGDELWKGDLEECLDWSGFYEHKPVETVLARAYGHYTNTSYMHLNGQLSETEFKDKVLNYIMEQDALATDTEDEIYEELDEDFGLDSGTVDESLLADINQTVVEQEEQEPEEDPVMEANNYAVVIHTQIMENIGTAERPSWATAGTRVQLVQEGFTNYGEARSVAARVGSGEIPVEITEGDYVLGIDVMPTSEYRQFHEDNNAEAEEEAVAEDVTDDVFFAQQVQEMKDLAGVHNGTYTNKGTPSVHETRARLEALSKNYFESAAAEEAEEEAADKKLEEGALSGKLTPGQLAHTLRVVKETLKKNPTAHVNKAIRAVCQKLYGDPSLDEEIIKHAEFEYGTIHDFDDEARGKKAPHASVTTKHIRD